MSTRYIFIQLQGPVQTSLHSCALPNWCKYGKRVVSESLFGPAVSVWCGKSVKFNRVCQTFVELNLGSTHGAPSESDVTPVLLQSRNYSISFGTWKVWCLNQASLCRLTASTLRQLDNFVLLKNLRKQAVIINTASGFPTKWHLRN